MHFVTFLPDQDHPLSEMLSECRKAYGIKQNYMTFGVARRKAKLQHHELDWEAKRDKTIAHFIQEFPEYKDREIKMGYNHNQRHRVNAWLFEIKIPYVT